MRSPSLRALAETADRAHDARERETQYAEREVTEAVLRYRAGPSMSQHRAIHDAVIRCQLAQGDPHYERFRGRV